MPTRDEPVYVRVEDEHILATLISPGSLLPGVLFVHGWGGDQQQYVARARALAALGCVCLTFDLRGHAQTRARHDTITREESMRDILAAYDFLASQHNVDADEVAVVGSSYGGYLAALLTARRPVKWLSLRAPALYKDSDWRVPKHRLKGEQGLEKYRQLPVSPDDSKALQACRDFTGDLLLVESQNDTMVPHQVVVNYREACLHARSLTYRLIDGADHGLSTDAWQNEYTQVLVNWFTEIVFGKRSTDSPAAATPAEAALQPRPAAPEAPDATAPVSLGARSLRSAP